MLPPRVAESLRKGEKVEPESYPDVSVVFMDVVGFTAMSASMSAETLTSILDRLYSAFDQLIAKYGLFKGEERGDAFIAAAGMPLPQKDHALRVRTQQRACDGGRAASCCGTHAHAAIGAEDWLGAASPRPHSSHRRRRPLPWSR